MSLKLYEYDDLIAEAFEQAIDPETGEIINDLALQQMEALEGAREDKIEGILLWYKDLCAEAEAVKTEKQKLGDRQKALENKAERLKGFMQRYLNGEKFKTSRVAVSYRKTECVEFFGDAEQLPEDLRRVKTEYSPDKTAIKAALKAGKVVEGAALVPDVSMTIK